MSLGVEDPVLERQVVVVGEEQVEVPGVGGGDTEEKSLTGDGLIHSQIAWTLLFLDLYDIMS